MPELPEVEITRRRIARFLIGRRIASVRTTRNSYFFLTRPRTLARGLVGRSALALDRKGKYLVVQLDDGKRLVLHLGMTGQLFSQLATSPRLIPAASRTKRPSAEPGGFEPDEHTHLTLVFEDGGPWVMLRDVRKFGKVRLLRSDERDPRLERLGVDALAVSGQALFRETRRRRVAIKSLLLDQAVLAGIGNIYADESLFHAGIRPRRRAGRLTRRECERLAGALRHVLDRAIETGGSSLRDFVGPDGRDGAYQNERRVYARAGAPCHRCGSPIRALRLGQRSAHYCPICQI
ncbi:MAG: bifunctional DNA-formamidopyrimidine glycosylase/DNA-(apurinic or apyrimidinic site) lyase [Myxococcota bacterium]